MFSSAAVFWVKVSLGHEVYVACRTEAKAKAAASTSGAAGAFACDLSSLESVRSFAQAWGSKPIDSLCLNAGRHFFILCVECSSGYQCPDFPFSPAFPPMKIFHTLENIWRIVAIGLCFTQYYFFYRKD